MNNLKIFKLLQFSQAWIDLGILTKEKLEELQTNWDKGEDNHPEHYRWQMFLDFLKEKINLTENLANELYNLG